MQNPTTPKPVFYIKPIAGHLLSGELETLANTEGSGVSRCPNTLVCVQGGGEQTREDLYEIPETVRDRLCGQARRRGLQFELYTSEHGEIPRWGGRVHYSPRFPYEEPPRKPVLRRHRSNPLFMQPAQPSQPA